MHGALIPLGGGDPIPLPDPKRKKQLLIGRRESCDIVLRFANVSAHHAQLTIDSGYWYVRDLQSRNGIKVNDVRVQERRIDPDDVLSIAKHRYRVEYDPVELGAVGPPPPDNLSQEIMKESLLSRAGLDQRSIGRDRGRREPENRGRYDPTNMNAGQIDLPDDPV
ncbi:MAG TPA: FHA domain-containing protein [Lacipirellulaceae bacterium]|nr:FHA domain-containing protein [Lacipirellulaceae bacterium]